MLRKIITKNRIILSFFFKFYLTKGFSSKIFQKQAPFLFIFKKSEAKNLFENFVYRAKCVFQATIRKIENEASNTDAPTLHKGLRFKVSIAL